MWIVPIISLCGHITVNLWLLFILWRRRIWRQLPWFACYASSELVGAWVGLFLWVIDRRLYVTIYWWMAAVQILLLVLAVRESFVRTFVGFGILSWFPWLLRSVIGVVLVYSAWKAIYAPPVHNTRIIALIVGGEFTFYWGIVAVGVLSLAMVWLFQLPSSTREMAVMDGCTILSVATLITVISRSVFGTRFALITQHVPELGYVLAAIIWIKYMSRPEAEAHFKDLGLSPEAMSLELRRYRKAAERLFQR
jgi:hypothetical protein